MYPLYYGNDRRRRLVIDFPERLGNCRLHEYPVITQDENKFQVHVDVQYYAYYDISVKIIDGFLVVKAEHAEQEDRHGGFVTRGFTRRYKLPDGIREDRVISWLSTGDKVLTIMAPFLTAPVLSNERIVPVIQRGPARNFI